MTVDRGKQLWFPENIIETTLRWDVALVSNSSKQVIMLELTVPWEERMKEANEWKRGYEELAKECRRRGGGPGACRSKSEEGALQGSRCARSSASWASLELGKDKLSAELQKLQRKPPDGCGSWGTNRGRMLLGHRPGIDHSLVYRQVEGVWIWKTWNLQWALVLSLMMSKHISRRI